jgi:predicted GH43/DUF377 family glycosyl hydrolase
MLSELFGDDPLTNQRRWVRSDLNPVIGAEGTGWAEDFIAACSVIEYEGGLRLYAEGSVGGHEQIGLFTLEAADPASDTWVPHRTNPILEVGDGFDRGGVFDPAVVQLGDRWLLYYSATEGDAHAFAEQLEHGEVDGEPADEAIGLAVSDDGVNFRKHVDGPVMRARCPFAVVHDGVVHLYYVRIAHGGYRVHLALSEDGVNFEEQPQPVLGVGAPGSWDAHSVTTPKIFRDGRRWCMAFAGDSERLDDPAGVGLAYSDDLRSWAKLAGNPVFTVGEPASFDCASVQSPVVRKIGRRYYMWYAGSDHLVRDGLHSQIGVASIGMDP